MTQRIYSRTEWGARYQDGTGPRPMPFTEFWLHHAAGDYAGPGATLDQDKAGVRRLESIGESRFGVGISYTFPVARSGRIFTGHSVNRVGAHTKGHNTIGSAFVLMQDCRDTRVTDAQVDTIARRMVIEHRAGRATRHTLNGGHKEASGNSTTCPETYGMAAIDPINELARDLWAADYPAKELNVALTADDIAKVSAATVDALLRADRIPAPVPTPDNPTWSVLSTLQYAVKGALEAAASSSRIEDALKAVGTVATPEALAAALAPLLVDAMPAGGTVTTEQLTEALRSVLGSVDGATPGAAGGVS